MEINQESGFFASVHSRLRNLISEKQPDFNGDLLMWNDFREGRKSKNYCFYQTEALHHPHKFTPEYKKFLDDAKYVFDYSSNNIIYYPRAIHLPLKLEKIPEKNNIASNNLVFYGLLTDRRKDYLSKLTQNDISIKISEGQYGKNLINLLAQYKFVLSIGSYDNITNDSFRIIPAIENGCIVLIEKCGENWFNEFLIKECPDRIIYYNEKTIINDIKNIIK